MKYKDRVINHNKSVKTALETILLALNKGQRKKLLDDKNCAEIFARYGVEVEE